MRSFWTWWIKRQKYRGKQQPIASNRVFLLILPLMCVCVCIFLKNKFKNFKASNCGSAFLPKQPCGQPTEGADEVAISVVDSETWRTVMTEGAAEAAEFFVTACSNLTVVEPRLSPSTPMKPQRLLEPTLRYPVGRWPRQNLRPALSPDGRRWPGGEWQRFPLLLFWARRGLQVRLEVPPH